MKAVMIMFDSLNLHMLEPYGCDWVKTPNFSRLAKKSVMFHKAFVGSMPCMPARRELHTGRYNFLHRSWGPLEPFDDSMPQILKDNGVYTYLVTDHYHYWEEGGANYHTKYSGFQFSRGQEGDLWIGDMHTPSFPNPNPNRSATPYGHQDWVNRVYMQKEELMPMPKTFSMGIDFIKRNQNKDNWFLQIETFDPHEPYFSPDCFKKLYDFDFSSHRDWPDYASGDEAPDQRELTEHFKYMNAALVSMCDKYLGKILDIMDEYDLWKDTMLIVNTDHGFLLGEHDFWGKCRMPFYNEIARTPLFIWNPELNVADERRESLVQTIDIPATLLDYFNISKPEDMLGFSLNKVIENDLPVRDAGIFGIFGGHVNVTDGKYVYMRAPVNKNNAPLFQYTYMPANMRSAFSLESMHSLVGLAEPFSFTKGCRVMKIDTCGRSNWSGAHNFGHLLFDIENDPNQLNPINDPDIEMKMISLLIKAMQNADAPIEQFIRLGLDVFLK
jgi:arylsulfatase A-like enzyme